MRVLILHRMMNPKDWRKSVESLELGYRRFYEDSDDIIVWNCVFKIPRIIRDTDFDLIIFTSTFLGLINFPWFLKLINDFSFLSETKAYKVALTQDEYQNPILRDKFLNLLSINEIHTCFIEEIDKLYPICVKNSVKFFLGFTGYVDDSSVLYSENHWKNQDRLIRISYRTQPQHYLLGEIGELKTKIADFFLGKVDLINGIMDISYKSKDVKFGIDWYDFLLNSRFVLGSLSGSSNIDYLGRLQTASLDSVVNREIYEEIYPETNLVNKELTAISPRNLEAAIFGCCQINIESEYNDIFLPWVHYIPLKRDFTNFEEVLKAMKNDELVNSIICKSRELVLNYDGFNMSFFYEGIRNRALAFSKSQTRNNIEISSYTYFVVGLQALFQKMVTFRILSIRNHTYRLINNFRGKGNV